MLSFSARKKAIFLRFCLLYCYFLAETKAGPDMKATTQVATRTTRYTLCGVYRYNISSAIRLAKPQHWNPLVAFFYTDDGLLDDVVDGIHRFFEKYAACGMSRLVHYSKGATFVI